MGTSSLPVGMRAVGHLLIYTLNPDGTLTRFKTYLVVKGYSQIYSVYYQDTLSLVVKMTSIRLFTYRYTLLKSTPGRIKNALLHGIFYKEVYMEQLLNFVTEEEYDKVYNLQNLLYGLKKIP